MAGQQHEQDRPLTQERLREMMAGPEPRPPLTQERLREMMGAPPAGRASGPIVPSGAPKRAPAAPGAKASTRAKELDRKEERERERDREEREAAPAGHQADPEASVASAAISGFVGGFATTAHRIDSQKRRAASREAEAAEEQAEPVAASGGDRAWLEGIMGSLPAPVDPGPAAGGPAQASPAETRSEPLAALARQELEAEARGGVSSQDAGLLARVELGDQEQDGLDGPGRAGLG